MGAVEAQKSIAHVPICTVGELMVEDFLMKCYSAVIIVEARKLNFY